MNGGDNGDGDGEMNSARAGRPVYRIWRRCCSSFRSRVTLHLEGQETLIRCERASMGDVNLPLEEKEVGP